ncbi:hypothetical protein CFIMG_001264RA [Ceratocystis fimbriata CBS 114723]|uniref:Rhodopsin domain-containing protein n=1 Tax=Ceratocystis fimbriata CBS 114723 TaxID=1035309 RepID=A0A2C5XBZ0_9PEZI|nr:hypothetical protein CFIMG_001264RA [Ceratocystis fimbriata CBS 114723]
MAEAISEYAGLLFARAVTGAAGAGDVNGTAVLDADAKLRPGYSDNRGPGIRASCWILGGLSLVFLSLRVYCKFLKHRGLYWDDYLLIASWLAVLGTIILTDVAISHGYGRHAWAIDPSEANILSLSGLMSVTFAIAGQAWSKSSFAMTLYRIATPHMRWSIWFIVITLNILMMIVALFFWVPCDPLEKAWKPMVKGSCWDPYIVVRLYIVVSVYSGIVDITLAFMPWKIVMGLQMKLSEKLGVATAMSMGVFAGVSAFIKASYLPVLAVPDFNYDGSHLVIWGIAETSVTIMAASIPVMRVLVREVVSTGGGNSGYNQTDPENLHSRSNHSHIHGHGIGTTSNAFAMHDGVGMDGTGGKPRSSFSNAISSLKGGGNKTKIPDVYGMTNISERSLPSSVSTMPLHPLGPQSVKKS